MNATLKNALAFFVDDIEAARDIFMNAVESAASGPDDELDGLIDEILEDSEEGPEEGFIIVEREAVEALRNTPYDVSDDLKDALENFNWSFQKAVRELKAALVREAVS
jgi:hypothetical protein